MVVWIWILIALVVIPALGGFYVHRGKARTLARLEAQFTADIRNRLTSISQDVGGTLLDATTLETPQGRVVLAASKAPAEYVIDVAKFVGKTALKGNMTVVRREDSAKVIATRSLMVLTPRDPQVAERYHILVSDVEEGQRWASAKLCDSLRELETAVRARCRLQMGGGLATISVFRGLAKTEELRAFYDRSVAVVAALEEAAGPKG